MSRRGRRSAKERQSISKGVNKFWDKKGRKTRVAAASIGTAIGGTALILAAKKGAFGKGTAGTSLATIAKKPPMGAKDFFKGVANTVEGTPMSKAIVPYRAGSSALATRGVKGDNGAFQAIKTEIPRRAGRAFGAIKSTPAAIKQGMRTGKPGDASYEVGRNIYKGARSIGQAIKKATKRKNK